MNRTDVQGGGNKPWSVPGFLYCFSICIVALNIFMSAAQAACSGYRGKVVINEYNYIENWIELKVLDSSSIGASNTFADWKLAVWKKQGSSVKISQEEGVKSNFQNIAKNTCDSSLNQVYIRVPFAGSNLDNDVIAVLWDSGAGTKGQVIDLFRVGQSSLYDYPAAINSGYSQYDQCSTIESALPSGQYDAPLTGSSARKDLGRLPDGTGVWTISQGTGANSQDSLCGSNDSLLSVAKIGPATVALNTNFDFALSITNGGTGGGALTGVTVTDVLPLNMTFVSCTTVTGSCTHSGGTVTWSVGTVNEGVARTATLTVKVTQPGVYTNTARAQATELLPGYTQSSAIVSTVTADAFNALDSDSSQSNFIGGKIYTKIAGTSFGLKVGALASGAFSSSFVGDVRVDLVANGTPGANYNGATGANANCPVTSTLIAATPASMTASLVSGQGTVTGISVANAYQDVRVKMSYPATGTPTTVVCSTDSFAIRPARFVVSSTNASNTSVAGTPMFKAGTDSFNLTAAAVNLSSVGVAGYSGAPVIDPSKLIGTPVAGTVAGSFGAANPATGVAAANFTYSEAGHLGMNADAVIDASFTSVDLPGDCTADTSNILVAGKYGCWFGSAAVPQTTGVSGFGRFIPDHFVVDAAGSALVNRADIPATTTVGAYAVGATVLSVSPGSGSGFVPGEKVVVMGAGVGGGPLVTTVASSSANTLTLSQPLVTALAGASSVYRVNAHAFTYLGEPMLAAASVQAVNGAGVLTQNYTGYLVSNWTDPAAANTFGLGMGAAGGTAIVLGSTSGAWSAGRAALAAQFSPARAAVPSGPFPAVAVGVALRDADGVTLTAFDLDADGVGGPERLQIGTSALRYGRASVRNAFGSDKQDLPLPAAVEYWNGNYWETNSLDLSGSTLSTPTITHTAGTGVTYAPGSVFVTSAATPGLFGLSLRATGPAEVDLAFSVPDWLKFPWSGAGMENPSAKASFGVYSGSNRFIYRREVR